MSEAQPLPVFANAKEREVFFRNKLATCSKWAMRALEIIYAHQTAAEQQIQQTVEHNGVGFGGTDGEILSSFAQRVIAWKAEASHKYPSPLSPKQMAVLYKRMPKYAVQLIGHLEADGKLAPILKKGAGSSSAVEGEAK